MDLAPASARAHTIRDSVRLEQARGALERPTRDDRPHFTLGTSAVHGRTRDASDAIDARGNSFVQRFAAFTCPRTSRYVPVPVCFDATRSFSMGRFDRGSRVRRRGEKSPREGRRGGSRLPGYSVRRRRRKRISLPRTFETFRRFGLRGERNERQHRSRLAEISFTGASPSRAVE